MAIECCAVHVEKIGIENIMLLIVDVRCYCCCTLFHRLNLKSNMVDCDVDVEGQQAATVLEGGGGAMAMEEAAGTPSCDMSTINFFAGGMIFT